MKHKRLMCKRAVAALLLGMVIILTGCGASDLSGNENAEKPPVTDETKVKKPVVTPYDWETPVLELGEEYPLGSDVENYMFVSDDRYGEYTLESSVDILSPGEYEIRITGHGESYVFPVTVKDTISPEMELLYGYVIAAPGSSVTQDAIFVSVSDNDPEFMYGYYGLQKVMEIEEFAPEEEGISYEHRENAEIPKGEIADRIILPEEEGAYLVNAVAIDRSGNAVISPLYILVDGTGPRIGLPKTKITVYLDQDYDFMKNVTVEDNLFAEEECTLWIDEEEYEKLSEQFQNGQTGTYTLTYYAADAVGNTTEEILTVIVEKRPASQGNSSVPGQNSGEDQGSVSADSFDLNMAKAAFDAVNAYRTSNGLSALTWSDALYENCKVRAAEIVSSFSHTRPSGESCFTAITVSYGWAGENIAYGYSTAQAVADAWWNSEGHRANMLHTQFTQAAIACYYANGRYYWVNLFIG